MNAELTRLRDFVQWRITSARWTLDWLVDGRKLTPPLDLAHSVGSDNYHDFWSVGEEFLGFFINLGSLAPHERVLDIGCGCGRMALALTRYIDSRGRYDGFDVERPGVEWCTKHITPRFPNYTFRHVDLYNSWYNPSSQIQSSAFIFPYPDASFNFVFLTSVFTHMLPPDLNQYLREIARVLRSDGRCLATFFLLNDESLPLVDAQKDAVGLAYRWTDGIRVKDMASPERAIGYPEPTVRELYKTHGLRIHDARYGSWCGRSKYLSYQDIIVSVKD